MKPQWVNPDGSDHSSIEHASSQRSICSSHWALWHHGTLSRCDFRSQGCPYVTGVDEELNK